ncbi:MAG: DUF1376 domain-containing protein, partial [Mesorhizobium sp.]
MSATPWHKRFHDDALSGYMGLTLEERGAYTTFLDLMYQRGEPIVENDRLIAGWMQVSLRKYRSLRDRLVALGKILLTSDGRLSNARFEKERENALEISRKAAENGANGGRKSGETRKNASEINASAKHSLEIRSSYPEARDQSLEKKEKETPTALSPPTDLYAFQGSTIRLTGRHLEQWRSAFPHISLESELLALDEWAGEQGGQWFHAVSSALAKKERAARDRINIRRTELEAGPAKRAAPDR